ncbi:hypothetical protein NKDENANG_02042 [Candidatus Entotheonellaceae bacterium PAL068K]
MDIKIKTDMTLQELCELKENGMLKVNHEYQRGERWTPNQKQMFIDSLLRGYSAPAFYFHKTERHGGGITNTYFEIIDGQQRTNAIAGYFEGGFPLLDPNADKGFRFPNFVKRKECPWGGKRFEELSEKTKEGLKSHKVVIYEITTDDENEVRDLFIRLQAGTPLTPQDKRDAWPGNFTDFILTVGGKEGVDRWYGWDLFKQNAKVSKENQRRQLTAQVFMLYSKTRNEQRFCDIKSSNIDQFYHENVDFDSTSEDAKDFEKTCKLISRNFASHPKIVGHHLIHLVLFVSSIGQEHISGWEAGLPKALHEFKNRCDEAERAAKNNEESEFAKYYSSYAQWARTGSDMSANIQRRHIFFREEMVKLLSPKKRDPRRGFTNADREIIFYRDRGKCQYCAWQNQVSDSPGAPGEHTVAWEDAEIQHILPHSEGGETILANGVLVHRDCHPRDKLTTELFREWWYEKEKIEDRETKARRRTSKSRELPPNGTELSASHKGTGYTGMIEDGKIVLSGAMNGRYSALSTAAGAITQRPTNGWDFWRIKTPDNDHFVLATDWREQNNSAP